MKRLLALVASSTLAAAGLVLPIGPSGAGVDAGQAVYVVHGIEMLPVDVCVGDDTTPVIPDFQPGDVEGPLPLPPGDYEISLHTVGEDCNGLIYAETVTVGAGSSTIVAWPSEGPDLAVFPNEVECTEPGAGHITARHTAGAAAAGPVDVFADGGEVVSDLQPGEQATLFNVPVGTYSVEVRLDGSGTVVLGPADVQVVEGQNLVLHVVNALEKGGQPASVIPLVLAVGTCTTPVVPLAPSFTG